MTINAIYNEKPSEMYWPNSLFAVSYAPEANGGCTLVTRRVKHILLVRVDLPRLREVPPASRRAVVAAAEQDDGPGMLVLILGRHFPRVAHYIADPRVSATSWQCIHISRTSVAEAGGRASSAGGRVGRSRITPWI